MTIFCSRSLSACSTADRHERRRPRGGVLVISCAIQNSVCVRTTIQAREDAALLVSSTRTRVGLLINSSDARGVSTLAARDPITAQTLRFAARPRLAADLPTYLPTRRGLRPQNLPTYLPTYAVVVLRRSGKNATQAPFSFEADVCRCILLHVRVGIPIMTMSMNVSISLCRYEYLE